MIPEVKHHSQGILHNMDKGSVVQVLFHATHVQPREYCMYISLRYKPTEILGGSTNSQSRNVLHTCDSDNKGCRRLTRYMETGWTMLYSKYTKLR